MAVTFKNFRNVPVFVSSTTGFTFRIGAGETKVASDAVAQACLEAGLAPVEGVESFDTGAAQAAQAALAAQVEADTLAAETANAEALAIAAEKAKRSAAAKKAAATRKAKESQS